jgi:asparagine synthase (glutamine-hydrolysing)
VKRSIAGVLGAGAARLDVRRAFEPGSDVSESGSLSLAYTGGARAPGAHLVLFSGRLHNARELAAALGEPGTDAERLVTLGVERWGEGVLARLRGAFVLVAWDPAADAGLLAVDQLGVGGLFLADAQGGLAFATEIRELLRILPRRPGPDPDELVRWLAAGSLAPGATLFDGVRRLDGGHVVRLAGGRARTARYWAPRYTPLALSDRSEAAAELRSALTRSVGACTGDAEVVGVQLSGGLDSSIVAALANGLEPRPSRLAAYSLVHPEHPEIDESAQIDLVAGSLDLPVEPLAVRGWSALTTALEFQREWEVPTASVLVAFNLPLLRLAAADGVEVLLDGEGGDEVLGCSEYLLADRIRRGDLRSALALARRLPGMGPSPPTGLLWAVLREFGLKGAAPYTLHRALRRAPGSRRYAPPWLLPDPARRYAALYDEWSWKGLEGPLWWRYLADLLTAGRLRLGAYDLLRRRASLAGIANTHPLLESLDLVELVLGLPPELALDPSLTRPLAREAVRGLLPEAIRLRPDKVDFSGLLIDALGGPDRALVTRLLGADDAELWSYVDRAAVHALVDRPTTRRTTEWARAISRLATTEAWLRSQAEPAFAERLLEKARLAAQ